MSGLYEHGPQRPNAKKRIWNRQKCRPRWSVLSCTYNHVLMSGLYVHGLWNRSGGISIRVVPKLDLGVWNSRHVVVHGIMHHFDLFTVITIIIAGLILWLFMCGLIARHMLNYLTSCHLGRILELWLAIYPTHEIKRLFLWTNVYPPNLGTNVYPPNLGFVIRKKIIR